MRKRKPNKSSGRHWCGGLLHKVGRFMVQCDKCHRVRFLPWRKDAGIVLLVLLTLLAGCNSPTSDVLKADVHVQGVQAKLRHWDFYPFTTYEVDFQVVETGGVGITITGINVGLYGSTGSNIYTVSPDIEETMGYTNRISANGNRYGLCSINEGLVFGTPVNVKVSVSWTDDSGNSGVSLGSGGVTL